MALFGLGKKKDTTTKPQASGTEAAKTAAPSSTKLAAKATAKLGGSHAHVLRNPRITEKATTLTESGAYVFDVAGGATKRSIHEAVSAMYNVTPRMVRVVRVPAKARRSMRTGKSGTTRGGKKAYVYLRKGDSITLT